MKDIKWFILGVIAVFIVIIILVINKDSKQTTTKDDNLLSGKINIEIKVKDYGEMFLELDADTAPITVTNFVKLIKEKYYDGLTFHRIIKGFMIQGGSKNGTSTSEDDEKTIKGEFKSNGVENNISHERGVISMARSSLPDSASTQFFIVHEDSKHLDGDYAAFGHVTKGIEVVDKICARANPIDSNGTIEAGKQPIIEYIKIVDQNEEEDSK